MSTVHGASHKALKYMRKHPATLAVYWCFIARTNYENVAYPSLRGLARDTGWSKGECEEARTWLIEHKALERVDNYIRLEWRSLEPQARAQRVNFDKSEYYRPTGNLDVDDVIYPLLYNGATEQSDIETIEQNTDVLQQRTSVPNGHQSLADVGSGGTELNTSKPELDSTTPKEKEAPSVQNVPAMPEDPAEAKQLAEAIFRKAVEKTNGNSKTRPYTDEEIADQTRRIYERLNLKEKNGAQETKNYD